MKATHNDALGVLSKLINAGYEAYLAGGCVRDILLGVEPNDYDITTSATPEEVQATFDKTIPVGISFGVVKVVCDGNREIDVATFRTDGAYTDNRRPDSVAYSKSAEEDVRRRDFTINGLLQDLQGNIVDYVGGQQDLKNKILRTIGNPNDRFGEDALRMMRAVRFAIKYNLKIEKDTWSAVLVHAPSITNISRERITDEFQKIMACGSCDRSMWMLFSSGLFLHALQGEESYYNRTTNAVTRYKVMLALSIVEPYEPFTLVAAIITHTHFFHVLDHLSLTHSQTAEIGDLLKKARALKYFLTEPLSQQRKMAAWHNLPLVRKLFDYLLYGELESWNNNGLPISELNSRIGEIQSLGWPDSLINGDDLLTMGYIQGETIGILLEAVRDEQLNGTLVRAQVEKFLLNAYPGASRRLADGTVKDGTSPKRMVAQCKHCKNIMSFMVGANIQGQKLWSSMRDFTGIKLYSQHSSILRCQHCATRRSRKGFQEMVD